MRPDSFVVGGDWGQKWASSNREKTKTNTDGKSKYGHKDKEKYRNKDEESWKQRDGFVVEVIMVKNGHIATK